MNNTETNISAARPAGQKFIVGDKILVTGHRGIVREVHPERPWASYRVEFSSGTRTIEFADQSFCDFFDFDSLNA